MKIFNLVILTKSELDRKLNEMSRSSFRAGHYIGKCDAKGTGVIFSPRVQQDIEEICKENNVKL